MSPTRIFWRTIAVAEVLGLLSMWAMAVAAFIDGGIIAGFLVVLMAGMVTGVIGLVLPEMWDGRQRDWF